MAKLQLSIATGDYDRMRSLVDGTLIGQDFWSYGLEPNRTVLQRFLERRHAEGLSSRLLEPDELFHPSSLETHKI